MAHVPFDILKIDILIGWERDLVRKFDYESYREFVQRASLRLKGSNLDLMDAGPPFE